MAKIKRQPVKRQLIADSQIQKSKVFKNIVISHWRQTRYDIAQWRNAWNMAENVINPSPTSLYNIYKDYEIDAHWQSQTSNREDSVMESNWQMVDKGGKPNEAISQQLYEQGTISDIIKDCLKSNWWWHTLFELEVEKGKLTYTVLPRKHVRPVQGLFLLSENDITGIEYRNLQEYGKTLVEYTGTTPLGLLNAAMPHLIMARFAQSCWSEYCEIFGMPIRTLKTNTTDAAMLDKAERMMREMSTAPYAIIDETENLDIANGNISDGAVYNNLINLCENKISLLTSGAIMGQDTKFGTRGKEDQSNKIFERKVSADKSAIERWINSDLIPALVHLKYVPEGLKFQFIYNEDTQDLFDKTIALLPFYEVPEAFIKNKFGIEVTKKIKK